MVIRQKNVRLPTPQYTNDIAIMDGIQDTRQSRAGTSQFISDIVLQNAKTVQLYLKLYYLSDILDNEGLIDEKYLFAMEPKPLPLQYPHQAPPSDEVKADWRAAIRASSVYRE